MKKDRMYILNFFYQSMMSERLRLNVDHCSREKDSETYHYYVDANHFISNHPTNQIASNFIDFPIEISHNLLKDAYLNQPGVTEGSNFTWDERKMCAFIFKHGLLIMSHLKQYNGVEDDYDAIAGLANKIRGTIYGSVFGI